MSLDIQPKTARFDLFVTHRRDLTQATREATKRTMLLDAYTPETLPGEVAYLAKQGE